MTAANKLGAEAEAFLADIDAEYSVVLDPCVFLSVRIFHKGRPIAQKEYCGRPTWGWQRWVLRTIRKHRRLEQQLRAEGARFG